MCYVYIYIYIYICMYVCMCVFWCVISTNEHIYIYIYIYVNITCYHLLQTCANINACLHSTRTRTHKNVYIYIHTINHIIYYMNTLNAGWTIPVGCSLWQSGTTIRHIKNHPPRHLPWACQKGNPWFQNVPDCAVSDRPLVSFRPFPKRKKRRQPALSRGWSMTLLYLSTTWHDHGKLAQIQACFFKWVFIVYLVVN